MRLIGYAPDLDQTVQGVITDCSAYVPTEKGMQSAPSAQDPGIAALAATCFGAAAVRKLDNSTRVIAGSATKLYELSALAWTDRTRAVGGDYTLGSDSFWRFAQFGDTTLAAAKSDTLQASSSVAFANVTGSPKAAIVETVGNFVFLCDTNEATYGDSPNRWWCSAIRDHTDWTPSIATQSATNTLVSAPGKIFAAKRFGDQIVVYKERAMYVGTYVGAPLIWDFQQVPGEAGCSSQEAVVNIGNADNPVHIFMGADDFWRFDGARPVPLGGPLRKTVYADLSSAYAYRIKTLHDRVNSRVYFLYPSRAGNGTIDSCVVYHYRNNTWGRDDRSIEAALEYVSGGLTYDTWDVPYPTYNNLPTDISYDSPFWTSGQTTPGFFNTSHKLLSLDGVAGNSSFTLGDLGDDDNFYLLNRVKPRWLTKPTSATMTNYYKNNEGDALTTDATTTMSSSRFDVLRSARWHRLQFNLVGDSVANEIDLKYQTDGSE
jgi:hypothetical protein